MTTFMKGETKTIMCPLMGWPPQTCSSSCAFSLSTEVNNKPVYGCSIAVLASHLASKSDNKRDWTCRCGGKGKTKENGKRVSYSVGKLLDKFADSLSELDAQNRDNHYEEHCDKLVAKYTESLIKEIDSDD